MYVCLYRPPDASLNDFNRFVEDILSAISFENKLFYIIGDFNINILNSHSHQPTNEFINLMTSNSLYPLISKRTGITSSTATLIDNIFTNNLELNMNSGILYTDLSDHLPVFQVTQVTLKMIVEPPRQKRFVCLINSTTMSAFRSKLEGVDWSSVYSNNSVNEFYDTFSSLLTSAYSMSFPLQPACSKPHRSSKPWFSNGLFTSCKRKNSLYKQFQLNPTALNKLRYNKYRNKYNFLIKLARKKFFHDKLLYVSSDLRKTWPVIKQIISKKEPEQRFNNMKDSSGSYSNPTQIATKFNNFFANVGPSLANKISPTQITYREFLIGHYAKCFYLNKRFSNAAFFRVYKTKYQ